MTTLPVRLMFMGAIALLTGCIPTMVECRYFHLNAQPGLVVLAKSSSYGECRCRGAQAATEYRLSRTNYVIDFAIGDRWYPQLMLDAHDGSGHPLEIRSAHFRESRRAGKPSPILIRGEMYRYFVRAEEVSQKVLSFEILDLSGKILGAETVPFELRNATAWEANAL